MGSKTNFLELALLDHVLGGPNYTRPATVYLALFTDGPNEATVGTEVDDAVWTNYERTAIVNNDTNFPSATTEGDLGKKVNGEEIDVGTAETEADVTLAGWALMDAAEDGNMLYYGEFDPGIIVQNGNPVRVPEGALEITED